MEKIARFPVGEKVQNPVTSLAVMVFGSRVLTLFFQPHTFTPLKEHTPTVQGVEFESLVDDWSKMTETD